MAASQVSRDGRRERTAFFQVDLMRIKIQLTISEPHPPEGNILVTFPPKWSQPIAARWAYMEMR